MVNAQSTSVFAPGEAQRVYDLLDGLGCIGNSYCSNLGDFTPTTACDYSPGFLDCNSAGLLSHLYDVCARVLFACCNCRVIGCGSFLKDQGLTGTIGSNLHTFSALTFL
jgi:hypothetical protein